MTSTNIARIFHGLVTLIVLCSIAKADDGAWAPEGTAPFGNVGESEVAVRTRPLELNARSRRAVPGDGLIAQLDAYTALVGKGGNASGAQSSSAMADTLRRALSKTGQELHSPDINPKNPASAPSSNGAKVIEVPRIKTTFPPKPSPKTVFVFANGERLEVDHYTIDADSLHLVEGGQQRTIGLSTLDIKTTLAANRARGITLKIPQSRSELTIAF